MARNRFKIEDCHKLFNNCEISKKYDLLDGSWVGNGNFGAVFQCKSKTAEEVGERPHSSLCNIAPSSTGGKNNTIHVVKIIPIDVKTSGALNTNNWMTESEANSELQKHSDLNLLNSNKSHILQIPVVIDSFRSELAVFLIMHFINGINLSSLVKTELFFSNRNEVRNNFPRTAELSFQLLKTLLGMHSSNLIHLDIKPENIMCSQLQSECLCPTPKASDMEPSTECVSDSNFDFFFDDVIDEQSAASLNNIENQSYRYTVLDFGCSLKIDPNSKQEAVYLQRGRGTALYAAPEVRECGDNHHEVPYTKACDCWSLGATLYYAITANTLPGYPKHTTCTEDAFMQDCTAILRRLTDNKYLRYVKGDVNVQPVNASDVVWESSPFCLIFQLTKQFDRLSIEDAICHPFLQAHGLGCTPETVVSSVRHFNNADVGISMLWNGEKAACALLQRSQTAGGLDVQEHASFILEQRKNHVDNGAHNYKPHNKSQHSKLSFSAAANPVPDNAIAAWLSCNHCAPAIGPLFKLSYDTSSLYMTLRNGVVSNDPVICEEINAIGLRKGLKHKFITLLKRTTDEDFANMADDATKLELARIQLERALQLQSQLAEADARAAEAQRVAASEADERRRVREGEADLLAKTLARWEPEHCLWRGTDVQVTLTGATGPWAGHINQDFCVASSDAKYGGGSRYAGKSDSTVGIEYLPAARQWQIKLKRDLGKNSCFAYLKCDRPFPLLRFTAISGEPANQWLVDDGVKWTRMPLQVAASGWAVLDAGQRGDEATLTKLIAAGANMNKQGVKGDTALIWASFHGRSDVVNALITAGADVDLQDRNEKTALMMASDAGHFDVVKALLKKAGKANVNKQDCNRLTALMMASSNGHFDVVKALIAAGADVNKRDTGGHTALILASSNGHFDVVKALIKKAKKANVNKQGAKGDTALMWASFHSRLDVVKALIDKGADVNMQSTIGYGALMIASCNGDLEVVKALIAARATVNLQDTNGWTALIRASWEGNLDLVKTLIPVQSANLNLQDTNGYTALLRACDEGHLDVALTLIAAGANVDLRYRSKPTALMMASKGGHLDVVESLLYKGADVNLQDSSGETALMNASDEGHFDVVEALIEARAKLNLQDRNGKTALMMASSNGHFDVVEALIAAGAKLNKLDRNGKTALMMASEEGHSDVVKALLKKAKKANVNLQDGNGYTALIWASWEDQLDVVEALIKKGADLNLRDTGWKTALMKASEDGHSDIVEALIESGADMDLRDTKGYTALMMASYNGHSDIVEALVDEGADVDLPDPGGYTAPTIRSKTYRILKGLGFR